MKLPLRGRVISALLMATTLATQAVGHGSTDMASEGALKELVSHADLIFAGRVIDVDYRLERGPGDVTDKEQRGESLPVTYVTYMVEDVLRGKPTSKTLTMRFLGGTDGQGRFLTVSGVPRFQAKETDLLFVSSNGSEGECPLVECEHGRFRVLEGGIYDAFGVAVQAIVDQGVIARGQTREEFLTFSYPAPSFDDLIKLPQAQEIMKSMGMSHDRARARFERDAPKQIVIRNEFPKVPESAEREQDFNLGKDDPGASRTTQEPLRANPISAREFFETVAKMSEEVGGDIREIRSIEPGQVKQVGYTQVKPAPERLKSRSTDEAEALRQNDGNPVLK